MTKYPFLPLIRVPYPDSECLPQLFNLRVGEPGDLLMLLVEILHKRLVLNLRVVDWRERVNNLEEKQKKSENFDRSLVVYIQPEKLANLTRI